MRERRLAVAALMLLFLPGCASRGSLSSAPATLTAAGSRPPALARSLDALLAAPAFTGGIVGIRIDSIERGSTLFARNAGIRLVPASNMKLVTAAAAAERLGWDFSFETTIAAAGPLHAGVLDGDLIFHSSGDPTVNSRDERAGEVLAAWADALWAGGLRRVTGRVVGDDNAFDDQPFGDGWAWDNLPYGYSAAVGPLQVFENAVVMRVVPATEGQAAAVHVEQPWAGFIVESAVTTGPAGSKADVRLARRPGDLVLRLSGTVPAGGTPALVRAAVENPTLYAARALREALQRRGIAVDGEAVDGDDLTPPPPPGTPLLSQRSPALREFVEPLMKSSQNLYAETLLRAMATGDEAGTAAGGRAAVEQVLASWGLNPAGAVIADGSGLSRYNFLTADTIAGVLARMYRDERHRDAWLAALPVAGVDGTLERRMLRTPAAGNARAKTGSLANVRSLSGYVRSRGGELLSFAILVNNVTAPGRDVEAAIDAIVVRLANSR